MQKMGVAAAKWSLLAFAIAVSGCGGGSAGNAVPAASLNPVIPNSTPNTVQDAGAPRATGDTATDGFNWFNYRRQQLGLTVLAHNAFVDQAAQAHSNYQKLNNQITHNETPGAPGFTGASLSDRLVAAGYRFNGSYAYGEVISASTDHSGVGAAENLITAIYHRFVIFEPLFKEAGAGAGTGTDGYTYFTEDFVTDSFANGLGAGNFIVYPFANQSGLPVDFFSDNESPDPVPDRNEVGYPISVHADLGAHVVVNSFTVQPRGGTSLPATIVTPAGDPGTSGSSAAAVIPLNPLSHGTTYDVKFSGTVDGIPAVRSWSFTTQ